MDESNILEMRQIEKSFSGVKVLSAVDFSIRKGEIMALVGENGAGKSTLMRILTGIYEADAGDIIYKGNTIYFKNAKASAMAGIQIIHQDFNLFPNMSVAENIFLDNSAVCRHGLVDWRLMYRKTRDLISSIGGDFDPSEKVSNLTVQDQQIVEIAKTLSADAEVLVMDEPTSALPENEVRNLFAAIRRLKERGVSIIYVSHRLNEIFEICDRITVLRDGKTVALARIADVDQTWVISQMVGKNVGNLYPKTGSHIGNVAMEVNDMSGGTYVHNINFSVRSGEIVGLYGLVGSGAMECPQMIFGLGRKVKGTVSVHGKNLHKLTVANAIKNGIAYVPADRHREGIIAMLAIRINLSLVILRRISGFMFVKGLAENGVTADYIQRLRVKCKSGEQAVTFLSGGNQQKIVIAKWLASDPKVLILNDPTRGVDVGARAEIYGIINELSSTGMAVVITSSDIDEIMGMSDRILVFNRGRIIREIKHEDATQNELLAAANMEIPS